MNPIYARRHRHPFALRIAAICAAAGLAGALIFYAAGQQAGVLTRYLLMGFVYSCSIAPASAAALSRIAPSASKSGQAVFLSAVFLVLVATAISGTILAGGIFILIGLIRVDQYWILFWNLAPFNAVITLIFGISAAFYQSAHRRLEAAELEVRTRQMEEERGHKLLAEARLSSLESRIHPHFLFNTLNSIAALIPVDPARAEEIVGRLASLLRFSLNAGQTGLTTLEQEVKIVRDYLEIEQARYGSRLRYSIEIPRETEVVQVPPLALQSLVENSVKHSVAKNPKGAEVDVRARLNGGSCVLEIWDDGPGFALGDVPAGHGIDNLMGRLSLLFGDQAGLAVERKDGRFRVRMTLPV